MLKIVVIDANAISRDLLTTLLVGGGHDVIGSSNTHPASVARMIRLQPQVVCIDIGLDDADGKEALATLQSALPKALFFMVSGKFEADTVREGAERGVLGFIVKPFNSKTVLATIRNAVIKLARRQKADEAES